MLLLLIWNKKILYTNIMQNVIIIIVDGIDKTKIFY